MSLIPTPSVGDMQIALLTQFVIEWGTFLTSSASPLELNKETIIKKLCIKYQLAASHFIGINSHNHVSGKKLRIGTALLLVSFKLETGTPKDILIIKKIT